MTDELFKTLPQQIQNACATTLERYQRFLESDPGQDPKRVTAHHQAGKSAVTHMTALIKLLQLFAKNPAVGDKDATLESLLLRARHVLAENADDRHDQL